MRAGLFPSSVVTFCALNPAARITAAQAVERFAPHMEPADAKASLASAVRLGLLAAAREGRYRRNVYTAGPRLLALVEKCSAERPREACDA